MIKLNIADYVIINSEDDIKKAYDALFSLGYSHYEYPAKSINAHIRDIKDWYNWRKETNNDKNPIILQVNNIKHMSFKDYSVRMRNKTEEGKQYTIEEVSEYKDLIDFLYDK